MLYLVGGKVSPPGHRGDGGLEIAMQNMYSIAYPDREFTTVTRLLTNHIATMTEMREPHKVLERSGGKPVAILKNSQLVGYFVPEAAVPEEGQVRYATSDEFEAAFEATRARAQPILDYLRDK
jgi:antitoxin StbD